LFSSKKQCAAVRTWFGLIKVPVQIDSPALTKATYGYLVAETKVPSMIGRFSALKAGLEIREIETKAKKKEEKSLLLFCIDSLTETLELA
jgi:hypothetical protein